MFSESLISRMAPPKGALLSLRALLEAPGGPYRSLKGPEYLIFFAAHQGGLTAGIWAQIWSLRALWSQKRSSGAKKGPFGGSTNVEEAPEVPGRPPGGQI